MISMVGTAPNVGLPAYLTLFLCLVPLYDLAPCDRPLSARWASVSEEPEGMSV